MTLGAHCWGPSQPGKDPHKQGRCWSFLSFAVNTVHCFLEMQRWMKGTHPQDKALGKVLGTKEWHSDRSGGAPGGARPREDGGRGGAEAPPTPGWPPPTCIGSEHSLSSPRRICLPVAASGSLSSPSQQSRGECAVSRNVAQFELPSPGGSLRRESNAPTVGRWVGWIDPQIKYYPLSLASPHHSCANLCLQLVPQGASQTYA